MGAGSSVLDRGQVLERGVLALVIVLPIADPEPSIKQAVKAVEVQTLFTEPGVERLNGNSSQRLPGRSLEQPGSCACPVCNSFGDEFRPVITAQHHRCPMLSDEFLEMFDEPVSGD